MTRWPGKIVRPPRGRVGSGRGVGLGVGLAVGMAVPVEDAVPDDGWGPADGGPLSDPQAASSVVSKAATDAALVTRVSLRSRAARRTIRDIERDHSPSRGHGVRTTFSQLSFLCLKTS